MGVDELNDIVITECGEYLENLIQIAYGAESARRALQKDILVSSHLSASVGNDGDVVTAPTQFTGYAGVEVGIISEKKDTHCQVVSF